MPKKKAKTKTEKKDDAPKKKRLVLLDAHAILHRAYHALPDFSSPSGEPTGALYGLVAMLLKIVGELKPDYIVACYDLAGPTYRHEAFKEYKGTREKTDDMLVTQIERSRDIFDAFGIRIFDHEGFEADDMLGTIVEQTKGMKDLEVVIASGDMDTLQLVEKKRVMVYTLRKGIKDTVTYDEKGVAERFGFPPKLIPDYKGLRGDPSDNIPGIVGIGEKTATELIVGFGSIEDIYKKLKKSEKPFLDAGVKERMVGLLKENEEEAVFSKMLATIRRDAPILFTLPEKTWREKLDGDAIFTLFGELGFRTLAVRVRELFSLAGDVGEPPETETEDIDPQEVAKTGIALSILNSDITNPTYEDIIDYGRTYHKTDNFADAKDAIFKELEKQKLESVYENIELPLLAVIKKMQETGVLLDVPYLNTLSKTFHKELSSIEKRIYGEAGKEFNLNSPKQLADVLYDDLGLGVKNQKRTATGQRSTRESELEKLTEQHPIIERILRYRELQKLLSTYIDNLPHMVGKDGRLHTTFIQMGAATGRMASQNPGIQNIPIRTDEGRAIRKGFIAEKGYDLVSIDYSQIELRIAAILSEDKKLIDIFARGEDVHRGVAVRVFGVGADEVTPEMRRRAKIINFGILYGMGVNALRANLGADTSRQEAQEFLNAYFNTFTRLAEYLEETKGFARKNGYTETLFGRRRHFEGIRSNVPFIRAQAERMAINAPIQGSQADIIKIAMVEIDKCIQNKKLEKDVRMLLQVHDELVFEIVSSKTKEYAGTMKKIMESALDQKETHGVPIVAEVAVGKNWGELTRLEY